MRLYVLCGIPGSGKSTYGKLLSNYTNVKLHCYDELPNAHHPKHADQVHKTFWNNIAVDLQNGFDVICDDLHTTKQWRSDILKALSHIKCQKFLIVMDTPLNECIKRNLNRQNRLPDFILYDLYNKFEKPVLEEGFDKIIYYNGGDIHENNITIG